MARTWGADAGWTHARGRRPQDLLRGRDGPWRVSGGTGVSPGAYGIFGIVTLIDRLCLNGLEIHVPNQVAVLALSGAASERSLALGIVVWVRLSVDVRRCKEMREDEPHVGQWVVIDGLRDPPPAR